MQLFLLCGLILLALVIVCMVREQKDFETKTIAAFQVLCGRKPREFDDEDF